MLSTAQKTDMESSDTPRWLTLRGKGVFRKMWPAIFEHNWLRSDITQRSKLIELGSQKPPKELLWYFFRKFPTLWEINIKTNVNNILLENLNFLNHCIITSLLFKFHRYWGRSLPDAPCWHTPDAKCLKGLSPSGIDRSVTLDLKLKKDLQYYLLLYTFYIV